MLWIIQNSKDTPAGTTVEWCEKHKVKYQILLLPQDLNLLPNKLNPNTDGVVFCGGGMNVDEVNAHPWLIDEKKLIAECIKNEVPILGLCLGGQLIAESLGARVSKHSQWEVGWHKIKLDFKNSTTKEITVFQWHGYSFDTPIGAQLFATNECCTHQGFTFKDHVIGMQFHPEATIEWVTDCANSEPQEYPTGQFVQSKEQILSQMTNQQPLQEWYFNLLNDFFKKQLSLFEALGGYEYVEKLVHRFYHLMDTLPEAVDIRKQHQPNLEEAIHKLTFFLTGWLGGPQLYFEKYGHPRLRARHLPFKIGKRERDQWLLCMFKALEDCEVPQHPANDMKKALTHLADHMINQEE